MKELLNLIEPNINTRNRKDDLISLGTNIQKLISATKSKKTAASMLNLSVDMVNKFLSVFKVSTEVQKLIKEKQIDNILTIHALKSFNPADQLVLAKKLIEKSLNGRQMRALVPMRNAFKTKPVDELIDVLQAYENTKKYVNHFPYPGKEEADMISQRIRSKVGKEDFTLQAEKDIGIFTITKQGIKLMREDSAKKKMGFHDYLLMLFNTKEMKR